MSFRLARGTAAVCASALALVACSSGGDNSPGASKPLGSVPATRGWEQVPGPNIAAKNSSILVATSNRIIVLGGYLAENAKHVGKTSREGASYDPVSRKWTTIAPAPFTPFGAVWMGDRLFVAGSDCKTVTSEDEGLGISEKECPTSPLRLATYDPDADQWTKLPTPDIGYAIGGGNGIYGAAFTIGSHIVLRLERYDLSKRREITSYGTWSEPGGWARLPNPPGFDAFACQATNSIVSLSYAYVYNGKAFASPFDAQRTGQSNGNPVIADIGLTTLGPDLRWSKQARPATKPFEFEPEFVCAGDHALVWEAFHGAKFAFAYDASSGAISPLPVPPGGYPNSPHAVPGPAGSAAMWDTNNPPGKLLTLQYDARSNRWTSLPGAPATRLEQKPLVTNAADLAASVGGRTFLAREFGYKTADIWWTMTLPASN